MNLSSIAERFSVSLETMQSHLKEAGKTTLTALSETISRIAEFNLKYFAIALLCTFFIHNTIIVCFFAGIVFYRPVDFLAKSIDAIVQKYFFIVEPLTSLRFRNIRVLVVPIHAMTLLAIGAVCVFGGWGSTVFLVTAVYCALRCGSDLVITSRGEKQKINEENAPTTGRNVETGPRRK